MIYPKLSGPIGPQCPYLWAISGDIAGDIILSVDTLIRQSVSTDSFLIEVAFYFLLLAFLVYGKSLRDKALHNSSDL